jgi:hypothetical protein
VAILAGMVVYIAMAVRPGLYTFTFVCPLLFDVVKLQLLGYLKQPLWIVSQYELHPAEELEVALSVVTPADLW